MQKLIYALILVLIFFQGCEMNTSVDFIIDNPEIQTEDDVIFLVTWRSGVPLYYFQYRPKETRFYVNIDSDMPVENVMIKSYSIEIPELGISVKNNEVHEINIRDVRLNPNSLEGKRYRGGKQIRVEDMLLNVIENEKDLSKFRKVTLVKLIMDVSYEIEGVKKESTLIWQFRPLVRKSSAFWDKMMSV